MNIPQIHVSANVLLFREGKVLMELRKNTAGAGQWGFIGGHVEFGERIEECVRREVREETGLEIDNLKYCGVINQPGQSDTGRHYIHFIFRADSFNGEPLILEPDACEEWKWFDFNDLPENIFSAHAKYAEALNANGEIIEHSLN